MGAAFYNHWRKEKERATFLGGKKKHHSERLWM